MMPRSVAGDLRSRDRIRALPYVSRETFLRLERYVELLQQWQARHNLVSSDTIAEIWQRHILDSVQIFALRPKARSWVDIGSGGGLPGLVLASFLSESNGHIILVESNRKKAAFLQHVTGTLSLPVTVLAQRIEDVALTIGPVDVVTARALANLQTLLGYANPLLKKGAVALFLKGSDYQRELTEAEQNWHISYQLHGSITDPQSRIVEILEAQRRAS
jgi:16S rRNA (guanine527-N7)-methyltransferase